MVGAVDVAVGWYIGLSNDIGGIIFAIVRWNVIIFRMAFAALFFNECHRRRAGIRRTPTAAGAVSSSVAVVLTTTGKGLS